MSTYSNTPGTAVAVRSGLSLQDKLRYAEKLSDAGMLPAQYRKQPANVLYAVEYGEMLGLGAMAAITGIHVIEGKPTASAGLIGGLVRSAGHKLRVSFDRQTMTAKAVIVRADDPDFEFVSEWSLDRAKAADLTSKKVWRQYPDAMLKARAITEVARDACEDVLFGLHYTPEELGAEVDAEGEPIRVTAERVASPVTVPDPEELTEEEEALVAASGIKMPPPVRKPAPAPAAEEPLDAEVVDDQADDQVDDAAVELLDLKRAAWQTAMAAWPQLDRDELVEQYASVYREWVKDAPHFAQDIRQAGFDELSAYLNAVLVPLTAQSAAA